MRVHGKSSFQKGTMCISILILSILYLLAPWICPSYISLFTILSIPYVHGQPVCIFSIKKEDFHDKTLWCFQTFWTSFHLLISRQFSLKGYFFVQGGTFSKTSPSLKESRKENEKNLKIGRKKSNCPKKTYRWYFFDLVFSLIDPFFSRFEILPFNQIRLLHITFSFPIPFLFIF